MTETMVMMSFLTLIIFGFVHMCMLAATKSMVSLAAFSAARTAMVRGWQPPNIDLGPLGEFGFNIADAVKVQTGYAAAWQVLDGLRWWQAEDRNRPDFPLGLAIRDGRQGLTVTYRVPFGLPIFNRVPSGGLRVTAFSPYVIQPSIAEEGDNAR
jgi:hypothetical protein